MLALACGCAVALSRSAKIGADADQPRGDHVGRYVEHAAGVHIVEPLAVDEEQRETLLRGKAREEARRQRIARHRRTSSAKLASSTFACPIGSAWSPSSASHCPVNLGEGPTVERPAPLIAMLLGEHEMKRAAKERGRLPPLADEEIGEALEPRQHGDEPRPYGVVEFLCLHLAVPRRVRVSAGSRGNIPRESKG